MWKEKRKNKRIPLHFYLQVSEKGSSKHLGYMIDVSNEGFKLLSEEPISIGSEVLCVLHLPEAFNDRQDISFMTSCCWCRKDVNPDYYVSGYQIDDLEPDGQSIISIIMHYYGHRT
ncbi:PilZ domain-containing protein [Thermodesulfobacteriota bacterium]